MTANGVFEDSTPVTNGNQGIGGRRESKGFGETSRWQASRWVHDKANNESVLMRRARDHYRVLHDFVSIPEATGFVDLLEPARARDPLGFDTTLEFTWGPIFWQKYLNDREIAASARFLEHLVERSKERVLSGDSSALRTFDWARSMKGVAREAAIWSERLRQDRWIRHDEAMGDQWISDHLDVVGNAGSSYV